MRGWGHAPHEMNSWLVLAACSNGCNTVSWIAVLAGGGFIHVDILAVCGQALRQATSWCAISDGRRDSTGRPLVQEGCCKGALWDRRLSADRCGRGSSMPVWKSRGKELKPSPPQTVSPSVSLGPQQARPEPYPSFGASLTESGSLPTPPRPWRYPRKGSCRRQKISRSWASVDIGIAEEGGVTVTGVPNGTDEGTWQRARREQQGMKARISCCCVAWQACQTRKRPSHGHRIPQTENQLPRVRHGRGCVPRSMRQGR